MKKTSLLLVLISLIATNLHAQQHVYPLPLDSGVTVKGSTFCYMLPTTAFKVTVTAVKVRELKGYYSEHAQSLLGLNNIITENKVSYKLRDVSIEPIEIPDRNEAFLVQASPAQVKAGLLTQLTKETFAPGILNTLECYTTRSTPVPNFFKNYADISFTEQEDAFVETKIIDGVVTQVPANRTKVVNKTNLQKAQEAADAIIKSRKAQYTLVTGENETPYSSEALEKMLQELKQWEENYLSLFKGLTLEDEITYTFYLFPDQNLNPIAFVFSNTAGLTFENLTLQNPNSYSFSIRPAIGTQSLTQIIENSKVALKEKAQGYRYRNAVPMQISLQHQGKTIHTFGIYNMSQFGRIQVLPLQQDNLDIHSIGFIF